MALCILLGVVGGYLLARQGGLPTPRSVAPAAARQAETAARPAGGTRSVPGFFGRRPPAPGPNDVVVISSFESKEDLNRWEGRSAELSQSTQYATDGRHAGKVTFFADGDLASLVLSKAFRARQLPTDWSGYQQLVFDVYNPQSSDQRLIVQLKDDDERRCKQSLTIPASSSTPVSLYMAACKGRMDLRRVTYINLFLWKPKKEATFYIDHMRLTPDLASGAGGASARQTDETQIQQDLTAIRAGITAAEQLTLAAFRRRSDAWRVGGSQAVRVPLQVTETARVARRGWLASGGIPFPPGQVTRLDQVRVIGGDGLPVVAQLKPLAMWSDGSIKWLLTGVQRDLAAGAQQQLFLEYGLASTASQPASPLRVREDKQAVTVSTGPLKFTVSKTRFTILDQAWLDRNQDGQFTDAERIAGPGTFTMVFRGRRYESSRDTSTYRLTIEEQGPLSVTLKATGWFRDEDGHGFGQFVARLQAFSGQASIRFLPTFIYTGYPANTFHFKYEGLALPENEPVDEISFVIPVTLSSAPRCRLGDEGGVFEGPLAQPVTLMQLAHDAYALSGVGVPARSGRRATGWADLSDEAHGVMVTVRDFWQQFPKAFALDPAAGTITVGLWPAQAGPLNLQTTQQATGPDSAVRGSAFGLGKTHEVMIRFHDAGVDEVAMAQFAAAVHEPVHLRPAAEWVNVTGVLGRLASNEMDRQLADELFLQRMFNWAARQIDRFGWYGMLNFGDTLSWYRKEGYDKSYPDWGWHPEGRWGWFNCEAVGTHTGALLQYIRTGKWPYFQFGEDLARHIMDVDTVHYNTIANDPRLSALTDDEYSKVGSMHRHNGDHWGDRNEELSHTSAVGILLYYYLTGYPRARDVALEVGSFCQLEPLTYSGHPDIAPQRTVASLLWNDVALYGLTQEESYLRGAAKMARILLTGQQVDGHWTDTYNPLSGAWTGEENGSYMTNYTLPALIAYHRLTNQPEAAEAIVKAVQYLIPREPYLPFFDALAYSFDVTGDGSFVQEGERRMRQAIKAQNTSGDPMWDGMVYQKLTYGRVVTFLYSTPFLFDVLERPIASRVSGAPPVPPPAPSP